MKYVRYVPWHCRGIGHNWSTSYCTLTAAPRPRQIFKTWSLPVFASDHRLITFKITSHLEAFLITDSSLERMDFEGSTAPALSYLVWTRYKLALDLDAEPRIWTPLIVSDSQYLHGIFRSLWTSDCWITAVSNSALTWQAPQRSKMHPAGSVRQEASSLVSRLWQIQ